MYSLKIFKDDKLNSGFKIGSSLLIFAAILVVFLSLLPKLYGGTLTFINVLQPFIIGFVIAYFLNPAWKKLMGFMNRAKLFSKRPKLTKALSLIFLYIVTILLIVSVIVFLIPEIVDSVTSVTADLPSLFNSFKEETREFLNSHGDLTKAIGEQLSGYSDTLMSVVSEMVVLSKDGVVKVYDIVMDVTNILKNFFLGLFISIYMLLYKEKAKDGAYRFTHAFLSEKVRNWVNHFVHCLDISFSGFVLTQALNSLIIGIVCFILMNIFGMPYALISSVFVGICNMIPIFGQIVGAVPGAALLLFTDVSLFWGFIIMIVCIQQFECHILTPSMVSAKISIPPIWVVFGVIVCGGLMGVIGFFIGVPIVAVIYTLINESIDKKLDKKGLNKHLNK